MGHDARLIPPAYVKPYVKRGKNGAVDAAACCEAVSRPAMRCVPIKSEENQAALMLHRTRELLVKQRTMTVNARRRQLAECGLVAAKRIGRLERVPIKWNHLIAKDAAQIQRVRACPHETSDISDV